jgi:hypothetical protein
MKSFNVHFLLSGNKSRKVKIDFDYYLFVTI